MTYSGIICALSYSGTHSSMQTNAQQNIDHDAVVFAGPDLKVLPGDTIVVPEKVDRTKFVKNLMDWTQILSNFGVGVAAMKTLGD